MDPAAHVGDVDVRHHLSSQPVEEVRDDNYGAEDDLLNIAVLAVDAQMAHAIRNPTSSALRHQRDQCRSPSRSPKGMLRQETGAIHIISQRFGPRYCVSLLLAL